MVLCNRYQDYGAVSNVCTPLLNVSTFLFMTICKVLNFLVFRLPTQSNLELPANSNLIHDRDFISFFFFFYVWRSHLTACEVGAVHS